MKIQILFLFCLFITGLPTLAQEAKRPEKARAFPVKGEGEFDVSPDNKFIAFGAGSGIEIWSTSTMKKLKTLNQKEFKDAPFCQFIRDEKTLMVQSRQTSQVNLIKVDSDSSTAILPPTKTPSRIRINRDQTYLIRGQFHNPLYQQPVKSSKIEIVDIKNKKLLKEVEVAKNTLPIAGTFIKNNILIGTNKIQGNSCNTVLSLWNLKGEKTGQAVEIKDTVIRNMMIDESDKFLLLDCIDKGNSIIKVVDTNTWKVLSSINPGKGRFLSKSFHPDGKSWMGVYLKERDIAFLGIWDLKTGERKQDPEETKGNESSLAGVIDIKAVNGSKHLALKMYDGFMIWLPMPKVKAKKPDPAINDNPQSPEELTVLLQALDPMSERGKKAYEILIQYASKNPDVLLKVLPPDFRQVKFKNLEEMEKAQAKFNRTFPASSHRVIDQLRIKTWAYSFSKKNLASALLITGTNESLKSQVNELFKLQTNSAIDQFAKHKEILTKQKLEVLKIFLDHPWNNVRVAAFGRISRSTDEEFITKTYSHILKHSDNNQLKLNVVFNIEKKKLKSLNHQLVKLIDDSTISDYTRSKALQSLGKLADKEFLEKHANDPSVSEKSKKDLQKLIEKKAKE